MKYFLLLAFLFLRPSHPERVLICTGKNSHRYHSTYNCHGLVECHNHVAWITLDSALALGRTPCNLCEKSGN